MQSCVHSFFYFFARPTDPPSPEGTFYGDGLRKVIDVIFCKIAKKPPGLSHVSISEAKAKTGPI